MSETNTTPPPVVPTEADAVSAEAHASNCPVCGIPEVPCPRCNPKPRERTTGTPPPRVPGVVVR